ncbi:MAG: glycosyltransferase family 39 protein [Anaerolineae bacterium]|nr:glycosyltransferase family 39 protein [Anaerolineae bacterium]
MRTRRFAPLVLILLLATAARLGGIKAQSIWFDEGWSAYAAEQPTLIDAWESDATNPPLYYLLINVAARGFGASELALRYVSLLVGVLTIPLVYQLARHIAGARAGWYAALLAAASSPLWWAAQEARMYTLLALLVVICALAWQRIITRPTRAAWIALWLGELALLYAHNTGPVTAIWLNVVTLLVWLARRKPDWRLWLAGQVGVGVLWLPYFVSRYVLLQAANNAITSAPQIGLPLLGNIWAGLWVVPWSLALRGLPAITLLLLIVLIVGVLLVIVLASKRSRALWLVAHVVILTVGLVAGLMALGNDLHGRYLVMIVPLLLVALSVGLASIRRALVRYAAVTPFLVLFVFDLIAVGDPIYQHDDVRGMAQYYADHLTADDSVIAWSYADRYDLAYYWDRLGVQARRITLPEGADLDTVLPLLPTSGDVALNVWYTQRADFRGMMGCLLGSGTTGEPDVFTTYGMTTLVYRRPSLRPPVLQSTDLTFTDGGANPILRVNAVGQVTETVADRALCLPVQITLLRDVDVDLKAALIVQNDLGWTVASADAIFATANQRTSSALATGEALTAYPLLRLPYGAPPGDYRVFLRIYDEMVNPSGYNPPTGRGQIAGRDLLLATWTALPGADWARANRATDLPNAINLAVSGDLTLQAHNLPLETAAVVNGGELRIALLWQGAGALPELELSDDAGAWRATAPPSLLQHGEITLDWRALRVPPDAPSGTATLRLGGWLTLAHYRIDALPMITEPPSFARAAGIAFLGVGELVGYSLADAPFSHNNPPQITLVWRAGDDTPTTDYTVTVQLLDTAGRVIAQSDGAPGDRPTTGWRAGEYIVDVRTLAFNETAVPGMASLIVALYDPATGARVPLADGSDAAVLASGIEVR